MRLDLRGVMKSDNLRLDLVQAHADCTGKLRQGLTCGAEKLQCCIALVHLLGNLFGDGEDRAAVAVGDCLDQRSLFISRIHDSDDKAGQVEARIFDGYLDGQVEGVGTGLDNGGSGSNLDGLPKAVASLFRRGDPLVEVLGGSVFLVTQLPGMILKKLERLALQRWERSLEVLPPFVGIEELVRQIGEGCGGSIERYTIEMPAAEVELAPVLLIEFRRTTS